jgi:DNA-directed RNA polymerase specialized sigma24 family protein
MDDEVVSELQTMNSLLRALLSINLETLQLKQADKIWLLYNSGLAVRDIAAILRTSANNVAVALSALRKSKGAGRGSKVDKD